MNKEQASELITNTFNSGFELSKYRNFIINLLDGIDTESPKAKFDCSESYIKDYNTPPKNMPENSNGSGYLFLPLAPDNIDFNQDTEGKSFEIYSLDGKTSIIINDDKIEIKDNASGDDEGDNNNILIDENGINITDTNKNNILLNSDGISITDTNENNIIFNSDGISITDKNDNKITLSNSGTKIEDKNGNVIEMGTTSVKINNNLEVLQ